MVGKSNFFPLPLGLFGVSGSSKFHVLKELVEVLNFAFMGLLMM